MPFLDREEAGIQLAGALAVHAAPDALVLALPRGGVPVGWQVARLLSLPFEVLVARKVAAPGCPGMGLGAVAEGGARQLSVGMASALGVTPEDLARAVGAALAEVERCVALYREGRPLPELAGRTVLLVDDIVAQGAKMRVAVEALRARGVGRLVVAAPVMAAPMAHYLAAQADAAVALVRPATMLGAEEWYQRADPVSDAEVVEILARPRNAARSAPAPHRPGGGV